VPERVDVRIIAATHRDLDAAVAGGEFREDLLYRLRVVPIHIPPLRSRGEDVRVLAEHFALRYAPELVGAPRFLSEEALARLERHSWPGNVRELENTIKRALVLAPGEVLTPDELSFLEEPRREPAGTSLEALIAAETDAGLEAGEGDLHRRLVERIERPLLARVLAPTGGNQIRAAALLGINRNTLRKKIVELGIELPGRA
jgi:two-component system nitrogen regulation response regulator GlnG